MSKIVEHTIEILATIVILFLLWGIGYLITKGEDRRLIFKQHCVDSGMQYVNGDCIR